MNVSNNTRKAYPWIVVGLLWMVALLNYLDRQMLSTMQPYMKISIEELDSAVNFGRLMAIFLWIYALLSPVSGIIADRMNRKWLIVGSLFVWSGVTMTMGYASSFNQLYVLRAIMGVSEAAYIPAALSLIADYHESKTRSLAVALHTTGFYLGQALGGFGATVSATMSWQFTFHSFGLAGMLYSIVLILFLREKKVYGTDSAQKSTLKVEFSQAIKGAGMLLGNIAFWVILFYFSAPSVPGWATKSWLPTLFSNTLNMPMENAGPLATIVLAAASFIGVLTGGTLSDKWVQSNLRGRIYTGAIGLLLTIPALFLLGFGATVAPVLAGAVCFGLGFGMFDANNMPILCQFVSPRYRATGYGFMNMVGVSAGAFVTKVLGQSVDAGHLGRDFALLSLVVVVAVILQLTVLKPKTANMTA
ncbi:MFS transporter [Bacteroidia bacterium]|nr:MFS transporter [Bacteroidia bacterium]